jgi:hypothetical protein
VYRPPAKRSIVNPPRSSVVALNGVPASSTAAPATGTPLSASCTLPTMAAVWARAGTVTQPSAISVTAARADGRRRMVGLSAGSLPGAACGTR